MISNLPKEPISNTDPNEHHLLERIEILEAAVEVLNTIIMNDK